MSHQLGTIVFLRKEKQILLARKKRGYGAGYWNGAGGKVEMGEGIEAAAVRETEEEIAVTPHGLQKVAELDFHYPESEIKLWRVRVYESRQWDGEPKETEEMAPHWFDVDAIPYAEMWDDDKYWLPPVLAGKRVQAEFTFNEHEQVVSHKITTQP